MSILNEIFAHKKIELEATKANISFASMVEAVTDLPMPVDFRSALVNPNRVQPRLIAEVKHKSPSKGILREPFDPLELAGIYVENGAAAISVLTDQHFFGGALSYFADIHLAYPQIPLLRKDFIFDAYQIYEARVAGASAILLIVAMLPQVDLIDLIEVAHQLNLTALVEVHGVVEYQRALDAGAKVIGVNNRNLHDFTVSLERTFEIAKIRQNETVLVSESGIKSRADLAALADAGVDAVLVGESLVVSDDVAKQVRLLAGLA